MVPGKHRNLMVPFLHVWLCSSLSSDYFGQECALSLTLKSLSRVNFLAFLISALNWSMVLSMASTRWRLASLLGVLTRTLLASTASTVFLISFSHVTIITVIFVYGRQIWGVSSSIDKIEIDKFIITTFIRCFFACCLIITNFEQVLFKSFMSLFPCEDSFGAVIFWTNIKLNRIFVEETIVGGFMS